MTRQKNSNRNSYKVKDEQLSDPSLLTLESSSFIMVVERKFTGKSWKEAKR